MSTNEDNSFRVLKEFHNLFENSNMGRDEILFYFMQTWTNCNLQMELLENKKVDIPKFNKAARQEIKLVRDYMELNVPDMIAEIKRVKNLH